MNNDIDINFFSFFTILDKLEILKSDLMTSNSSTIVSDLDNLYDNNNILDSTLVNDSISKLKKIVNSSGDELSILSFIDKMEKFKDKLLQIDPDFQYYFDTYNTILDNFGDDYFETDNNVTPETLELLYPGFSELSPERKILIYDALKYINMSRAEVMRYSTGEYTSNYNDSGRYQIPFTKEAWCAYFCGGIISYRFGTNTILNPSYASVYKIVGNWNDQIGIAFSDDPRQRFILSSGSLERLNEEIVNEWEYSLNEYNNNAGTSLTVSDWIDENYIPISGDLIVFDGTYQDEITYVGSHKAYSHIGFVLGIREVDGELYVDTIEGNVSDRVASRSYSIDDPYILGYCHIDYEQYQMISETSSKEILTKAQIEEIASQGIDYSFNTVKLEDIID